MMCGKAELDLNTIFQTISHQFNSSDTNTDEEMCLCHACVSALSCKTDPWNSPKTRMIPSSFRTAVTSRFHSELMWTSFHFSPQLRKWFNLQESQNLRKKINEVFQMKVERERERDWSHSTEIFRKTINPNTTVKNKRSNTQNVVLRSNHYWHKNTIHIQYHGKYWE